MPGLAISKDQFDNVVQATYNDKSFRGEYDGNNNMIYAGFAPIGTATSVRSWQLQKLEYSGNNLVSVTWPQINSKASGECSFSWDARATYTYS